MGFYPYFIMLQTPSIRTYKPFRLLKSCLIFMTFLMLLLPWSK